MAFASNTLDFVRGFFKEQDYKRPPFVPVVGYGGMTTTSPYFSYGLPSGTMSGLTDYLRIDSELVSRFIDYEDQDDSPLISSSLDIYSDESTQVDSQTGFSVNIKCENEAIRQSLHDLFHKRLRIEESIWQHVRLLCKYGNNEAEIVAKDQVGVIALNALPAPTVRRIELPKQIGMGVSFSEATDTLGFLYDPTGLFKITTQEFIQDLNKRSGSSDGLKQTSQEGKQTGCVTFEGWEVMHMRLLGKNPNSIYGFGIGEPARWIFKRLMLLEDSIILHRLTRAPSRYAFYVDVSQIPPNETTAYLNKVKQSIKKQKFVNPNGNKMDQKYSILSSDDDFFLPTREGRESTRVESLAGPIYDHIEDIRFFENKLFAALKVPKPFLTYEETTAKTHLSAEDARFARTIIRIQREVRNGLRKVARVHLAAIGVNPDAVDFDITMTIPSAIFELAQLEIRSAELDLAEKFSAWADRDWIMHNILNFSDQQISEMQKKKKEDEMAGEESPKGSASGDLDKALSKRGQQVLPSKPENASAVYRKGILVNSHRRKNTEYLKERIEEERLKDPVFDQRWSEVTGLMNDLKDALGK